MVSQRLVIMVMPFTILIASLSARKETLERNNDSSTIRRRRLFDPRSVVPKEKEHFADHLLVSNTPKAVEKHFADSFSQETDTQEAAKEVVFKKNKHFADHLLESYTPEAAKKVYNVGENYWCKPAQLPPIDYHSCDKTKVMNAIPLHAELTDKFMILSIIKSLEEENTCCFIDERDSIFPKHQPGPFLENYLEPIGLPDDSVDVLLAKGTKMAEIMPRAKVWNEMQNRRIENTIHNITALGYENVEGHDLKRNMLKRIWRPTPKLRDGTCTKLQDYIQGEEYIALSINKCYETAVGDEYVADDYIRKVDEIVQVHFGGVDPIIFVATDACESVQRIRKKRPEFRIVSKCDGAVQNEYDLKNTLKWTQEEVDEYYEKFFVELFAMAGAKVLIGVSCTNLLWFSYFMREETEDKTFYVLEPNGPQGVPMAW